MKTYYIAIEECRSEVFAVEADTPEEALQKVETAYHAGEATPDNVDDFGFKDETDEWESCVATSYLKKIQ